MTKYITTWNSNPIIARILKEGFVTSGWCKKQFQVVYDTGYRDLTELMKLKVVERTGRGRSTRYVLREKP